MKGVSRVDGAQHDDLSYEGKEKMKELHDYYFRYDRDALTSQWLLRNERSIDKVTK